MEGSTVGEQPVPHLRNASTHLSFPLLLFVPTIDLDACSSRVTRVHVKSIEKLRNFPRCRITHNSKMLVNW